MLPILLFLLSALQLCSSIQWTNAGGNPLWEEPRNWDLLRAPTSSDDVIIDIPNIAGQVIIGGTTANCRSLTIGGTSGFAQTLTVQGILNVGVGGGKLLPNGNLILNSAPGSPFSTSGTFDGANKLVFFSGSLSGSGNFLFTVLNMSGPALKQINSTVTVTNTLVIDPGRGSTGVINIVGGQLKVSGTFKTSDSLTVSSSAGASLAVTGTFSFTAFSAGYAVTIRGKSAINNLNVLSGTVTLNDNVDVTLASVSSGATISVIGAGTASRTFGDITGAGILSIQGGSNTFTTLSGIRNVYLSGGTLTVLTKSASIGNFAQTGGVLQGPAPLTLTTASLANAQITNIPVTVTTLTLLGFTSVTTATITVTQNGVVSKDSQLTLGNGAAFVVSNTAVVSQSSVFKLLPSGTRPSPVFTNNGQWTSTSDLQIVVTTQGVGTFQLASGSTTTITGITFDSGSLVQTSSTFTSIGSKFNVTSVAGSGIIISKGDVFTVTGSITANSYTQTSGTTNFGNGNINTVDIQTGTLFVAGPPPAVGPYLSIGTLKFEGGTVSSVTSTAQLNVNVVQLTATQPKTFSEVTLQANLLTLDCGDLQCQVFTQDAHIIAGKKVVKRSGIVL